jgi:hypothetical protein
LHPEEGNGDADIGEGFELRALTAVCAPAVRVNDCCIVPRSRGWPMFALQHQGRYGQKRTNEPFSDALRGREQGSVLPFAWRSGGNAGNLARHLLWSAEL